MTDLCRQRVDLLSFLEGHAAENRAEPWILRRRRRLRFWELRGAPFHHVLRVGVFFALKVAGKAGFEFCFFVFFILLPLCRSVKHPSLSAVKRETVLVCMVRESADAPAAGLSAACPCP